ncbi:large ribosomal subunit protein uL16m-like [Watersipora subatra]|uniref:large ribosomal subunit protein uL16m-like n=1 Tax=Watersipora subatra TaxID=2589382 RepID=UPI00355C9E37
MSTFTSVNLLRVSFFKTGPKNAFQACCISSYRNPPDYSNVIMPPLENRKLPLLPKVPPSIALGQKMRKVPKRLLDMRGPELVHNKLIYGQFGIQAITGGQLRHGHLESSRLKINRKMDTKTMFAVWRVPPPWKPITKKPLGSRMGGGKGPIHHYTSPVKANRIILEMGGKIEWDDIYWILKIVAHNLPFKARVIDQQMLEAEAAEKQRLKDENINPFTFEYVAKNQMYGSEAYLSPYDYIWYNEHR